MEPCLTYIQDEYTIGCVTHRRPYDECKNERIKDLELQVEDLRKQVVGYRRMLWVLARKEDRLSLMIPKAELDLVPDEAELFSWYEPLFDAWMLKGICTPINQPGMSTPVSEKRVCASCARPDMSCEEHGKPIGVSTVGGPGFCSQCLAVMPCKEHEGHPHPMCECGHPRGSHGSNFKECFDNLSSGFRKTCPCSVFKEIRRP